jgi:hypothetical protein
MTVALGKAGVAALVRRGADHRGELGFDERLVDGLGGLADPVVDLRDLQCVQDLQQCRLVKGHRALCPFARTIAVVSLTSHGGHFHVSSYSIASCYLHHSVGRRSAAIVVDNSGASERLGERLLLLVGWLHAVAVPEMHTDDHTQTMRQNEDIHTGRHRIRWQRRQAPISVLRTNIIQQRRPPEAVHLGWKPGACVRTAAAAASRSRGGRRCRRGRPRPPRRRGRRWSVGRRRCRRWSTRRGRSGRRRPGA